MVGVAEVEKLAFFNSNIHSVTSRELDIFEKLIIIENWFDKMSKEQQKNLLKILKKHYLLEGNM